MRFVFIIIFALTSIFICAQQEQLNWTSEEINLAKTADTCSYLTAIEKDAIMYLNLARMYPKKFKEIELKGYFGTKKYGDYLKGSPWITSLEATLDTMRSANPLVPDTALFFHAKCFAAEMGEAGTTGHERVNCPRNNKYGECSSFGMDNGKDIIMQMLIDHNITGLGHRQQCLDPTNQRIGLSIHSHIEWGECCVINFIK